MTLLLVAWLISGRKMLLLVGYVLCCDTYPQWQQGRAVASLLPCRREGFALSCFSVKDYYCCGY